MRAKHTGQARTADISLNSVESLQMQDAGQHTVPQADLKEPLYTLERTPRIHLTSQNLFLAYVRQDL